MFRILFLDFLDGRLFLLAKLLGMLFRGLVETVLLELDPCFRNLYLVQGLYVLLAVDSPGLAFLYQLPYLHLSVFHLHVDGFLSILAPELVVVRDLAHGPFFVAPRYLDVSLVLRVRDFDLSLLGRLQLLQQSDIFGVLAVLRLLQLLAHLVYLSSELFLLRLQLFLRQLLPLHAVLNVVKWFQSCRFWQR